MRAAYVYVYVHVLNINISCHSPFLPNMTFISASSFSSSSSSLSSPISHLVSHNANTQRVNAQSQPESNDSARHVDHGKESALQRLLRSKHWVLTPPDTDRFRFCFKEPTTTTCSLDVSDDTTSIEPSSSATKTTCIISYRVDLLDGTTAAASREHSKPKMDMPIKFEEDIDVAPTSTTDNDMITLLGHCTVLNLAFEKRVMARYTLDNWDTFVDVDASYIESLDDGTYDRFSFTLRIHQDWSADELDIQLALCFYVENAEYWDNHSGENYHIKLIRSITVNEDKKKDQEDDDDDKQKEEQPVMWTQKTSALINDTHISPWTTSRFWIPGYMRHSQMTFARDSYDIEFLPPKQQPHQEDEDKDKDEKLTTADSNDTKQQEQASNDEIQ